MWKEPIWSTPYVRLQHWLYCSLLYSFADAPRCATAANHRPGTSANSSKGSNNMKQKKTPLSETTFIYHITQKSSFPAGLYIYIAAFRLLLVMMMICWPGHVASRPGPDPGPHTPKKSIFFFRVWPLNISADAITAILCTSNQLMNRYVVPNLFRWAKDFPVWN